MDDNKVIHSLVGLFLVLYGGLAAPKLPNKIGLFFNNSFFRLIVLFLVVYMSSKDISLSLLISICFVISLQTVTKQAVEDKIALEVVKKLPVIDTESEEVVPINSKMQPVKAPVYTEEELAEEPVTEEPVTEEPVAEEEVVEEPVTEEPVTIQSETESVKELPVESEVDSESLPKPVDHDHGSSVSNKSVLLPKDLLIPPKVEVRARDVLSNVMPYDGSNFAPTN